MNVAVLLEDAPNILRGGENDYSCVKYILVSDVRQVRYLFLVLVWMTKQLSLGQK
jgi:hypothetical protein